MFPSGNTVTSNADKKFSEELVKAGKLLDIPVLDYLIIGSDGDYFSFGDNSLMGE